MKKVLFAFLTVVLLTRAQLDTPLSMSNENSANNVTNTGSAVDSKVTKIGVNGSNGTSEQNLDQGNEMETETDSDEEENELRFPTFNKEKFKESKVLQNLEKNLEAICKTDFDQLKSLYSPSSIVTFGSSLPLSGEYKGQTEIENLFKKIDAIVEFNKTRETIMAMSQDDSFAMVKCKVKKGTLTFHDEEHRYSDLEILHYLYFEPASEFANSGGLKLANHVIQPAIPEDMLQHATTRAERILDLFQRSEYDLPLSEDVHLEIDSPKDKNFADAPTTFIGNDKVADVINSCKFDLFSPLLHRKETDGARLTDLFNHFSSDILFSDDEWVLTVTNFTGSEDNSIKPLLIFKRLRFNQLGELQYVAISLSRALEAWEATSICNMDETLDEETNSQLDDFGSPTNSEETEEPEVHSKVAGMPHEPQGRTDRRYNAGTTQHTHPKTNRKNKRNEADNEAENEHNFEKEIPLVFGGRGSSNSHYNKMGTKRSQSRRESKPPNKKNKLNTDVQQIFLESDTTEEESEPETLLRFGG